MFVPTHTYEGRPVRQEGGDFILADGKPLRGKGVKHSDCKVLTTQKREITAEHLGLVLQAASPHPGRGMMPGYAHNPHGDSATLIEKGKVRLSLRNRDGGGSHYLFDLPETFSVDVLVLEE